MIKQLLYVLYQNLENEIYIVHKIRELYIYFFILYDFYLYLLVVKELNGLILIIEKKAVFLFCRF